MRGEVGRGDERGLESSGQRWARGHAYQRDEHGDDAADKAEWVDNVHEDADARRCSNAARDYKRLPVGWAADETRGKDGNKWTGTVRGYGEGWALRGIGRGRRWGGHGQATHRSGETAVRVALEQWLVRVPVPIGLVDGDVCRAGDDDAADGIGEYIRGEADDGEHDRRDEVLDEQVQPQRRGP